MGGNRLRWVGLMMLVLQSVARADCAPVAEVFSLQGAAEQRSEQQPQWQPLHAAGSLCAGTQIRVADDSRIALRLRNQTVLRLGGGSVLTLSAVDPVQPGWLELLQGILHVITRVPSAFDVRTPFVNAGVEGTEFVVSANADSARVWVLEGRVRASNAQGELLLADGQAAEAAANQAPQSMPVLNPRAAVQWALYYPPLLELVYADAGTAQALLEISHRHYRDGELNRALAALPVAGDAAVQAYRAALLLFLGRHDAAGMILSQFDAADPYAPALRSVQSLVQGDRAAARQQIDAALARAPASALAHIAASYVAQSDFELEAARTHAARAAELAPAQALVWARLAELDLMLGDTERAQASIASAENAEPGHPRVATMQGFIALARMQAPESAEYFTRAAAGNPADPLPRLGMGLALIRQGELEAGREAIEHAALLDPNNAIIRSYLGKAYFEERRERLSATELQTAKALDPNDPTPWFYDAIRKQTENDPIGALTDLERSIALNDERAVYRSRLLLDSDLAARSAAVARIYRDLGFEQLALLEGWKSVSTDFSDFSGHRLLADSYAELPRHEIARVSELLQSQLWQPLNLHPLQPQLAEANLAIAQDLGPSETGFNEFNPLFVRNGVDVRANALFASRDTLADDLVVSGLDGGVSGSVGQFHYETDGFRDNNDQRHDVYNAYVQAQPVPELSVLAELRRRDSEIGDIDYFFDLDAFSLDERRHTETDSVRIGARWSNSPGRAWLGTVASASLNEKITDGFEVTDSEQDAVTGELQYLHAGRFDAIGGINTIATDGSRRNSIEGVSTTTDTSIDATTGYLYTYHRVGSRLQATLGISYDDFSRKVFDREQFNPKIGMIWRTDDSTVIRAAAFRTLKRPLVSQQTLEPTQVAGFNQLFDDFNGTRAWRYGAALDRRFLSYLWGGAEFSWRKASSLLDTTEYDFDDALHRAYLYATPAPKWALGLELRREEYKEEPVFEPLELTTNNAIFSVEYFSDSRWSLSASANFVSQELQTGLFGSSADGFSLIGVEHLDSNFWLVDTAVRYRLPRRYGQISIGINNVFDREFDYQDQNFRNSEPAGTAFVPDRTVFIRLELALR